MVLLSLLGIVLAGFALFGVSMALERVLDIPGLGHRIASAALLLLAAWGFYQGDRLLPSLFALQGIGFWYHARWRRQMAAASAERAPSES
jgi:hypothetical protein